MLLGGEIDLDFYEVHPVHVGSVSDVTVTWVLVCDSRVD